MNRYITSIAVTFLMTLCQSVLSAEQLNIAPTAEETKPLLAGEQAADFTVYRVDGSPYHFDADNLDKTTLLITFRGGWCPYCNTQLQELRDVLPDIKKMGVDILFLSGDRPEILYSSLKQETQDFIDGLDYTILSDADMDMGMAYGLAFKLPDDTITRYQSRNYQLGDSSIDKLKALAVPAVYIIRPNGEIAFAYVNPNYRVRLPADDV
ncbi:MAG: redoxin domain-containing protein, partial [Gammaproteobacteria bacterium]|nr:redoxin domain-containing protein [Gammaproteobacteria bacterium]